MELRLQQAIAVFASVAILSTSAGCTAAMLQGFADGLAAGAGASGFGLPSGKIMVFGGSSHSTYLGCLSCTEFASDSVFNQYGMHGSPYSGQSIFNGYSEFGSKYSTTSACNPAALDPPVIVDDRGNYYGRLNVNPYRADGIPWPNLRAWLAGVCQ